MKHSPKLPVRLRLGSIIDATGRIFADSAGTNLGRERAEALVRAVNNEQRYRELRAALMGGPWPLRDSVRVLCEFAERQLSEGYADHGWEELREGAIRAREAICRADAALSEDAS